MHNRIYLVHVDTLQNAVKRMTAELADALAGLGFETRLFDPYSAPEEFLRDVSNDNVAAVISLNLYGFSTDALVTAVNENNVPVFFYSTDHPYLSPDSHAELIAKFKRLRISLTGESELAAARRLHPDSTAFAVLRQGTAPHDEAPWQKRDIPNLVVGNNPIANHIKGVQDPELYRRLWPEAYGPKMAERLNRMVEVHNSDPAQPMLDVFDAASAADISTERPSVSETGDSLTIFDLYIRARVRSDGLRALAAAPGVICGLGWDFLRTTGTRAHFLGSVPSNTVLDLARRASTLYNLVPHYYSCSERVLEAATLGTPVVSTPSAFFEREFGPSLKTIANGQELADLLAHPEPEAVLRERAANARAIVMQRHTWADRATHIADFIRTSWNAAP